MDTRIFGRAAKHGAFPPDCQTGGLQDSEVHDFAHEFLRRRWLFDTHEEIETSNCGEGFHQTN
jgi:hypothetical protein